MKAAILQCDEVMEKLQPEYGSYHNMIQRMFESIGESIHLQSFDCRKGQYPKDINDYDFYITTGSKASVYDNELEFSLITLYSAALSTNSVMPLKRWKQ